MKKYIKVTLSATDSTKPNRQNLFFKFNQPVYIGGEYKKTEPLKLWRYKRPRTPEEREYNQMTEQLVNKRKLIREEQLNVNKYFSNDELLSIERSKYGESKLTSFIEANTGKTNTLPQALNLVSQCFGELKLKDVRSEHLTDFLNFLKAYKPNGATRYNPNTIRHHYARFYSAIKKASDLGYIPNFTFTPVSLPREVRAQRFPLSLTQIEALKNDLQMPQYIKAACLLTLYTGLRYSDIQALRWEDISEEEGKMYINIREKKTGKLNRTPLTDKAMEVLDSIEAKPGNVFAGITKMKAWYHIQDHCKRSGVKPWSFHNLRHTFATALIKNNVNIYTVKELLNHKSITTTERYLHCSDNMKSEAVELLPY
jgi:integrase